MMTLQQRISGCFFGFAVGDALGVPVEFQSRELLKRFPVTHMRGFGTWNQPAGTWSDDSSMAFCTAEALCEGYDLNKVGDSFVKWMNEGYWGAHHKVFDIGGSTRTALLRLANGGNPKISGNNTDDSNGNGSLMRIAPASIYFHKSTDQDLMKAMREISAITHGHFVSVFSCFVFSKLVQKIIAGLDKHQVFTEAIKEAEKSFYESRLEDRHIFRFNRILDGSITAVQEDDVYSSGYVLHTLEASIWCFLNTDSYDAAVLKAVNLGEDTDTTACVTGALAGLYYSVEAIPETWLSTIARRDDIDELAANFAKILV